MLSVGYFVYPLLEYMPALRKELATCWKGKHIFKLKRQEFHSHTILSLQSFHILFLSEFILTNRS